MTIDLSIDIHKTFGFNRKNLSLGGVLAKESIIEGRAINLASLDKNLLLRGNCSRRFFEDLRCNSVV